MTRKGIRADRSPKANSPTMNTPGPIQMTYLPGDWFAEEMKARIVPGVFKYRDASHQSILMVDPYMVWHEIPICVGTKVGRAWLWDGNVQRPTLTPSIRHVDPKGWHGFVTKGVMLCCNDSGNQPQPKKP